MKASKTPRSREPKSVGPAPELRLTAERTVGLKKNNRRLDTKQRKVQEFGDLQTADTVHMKDKLKRPLGKVVRSRLWLKLSPNVKY